MSDIQSLADKVKSILDDRELMGKLAEQDARDGSVSASLDEIDALLDQYKAIIDQATEGPL